MIDDIIDKYYKDFLTHVDKIGNFINENFGVGDYLKMKNDGIISSRNYSIKNSPITGYSFHGYGCGFQFRDYEVDIEFHNNQIGFTSWSFYSFISKKITNVKEMDVKNYLDKKVNNNDLKQIGNIYFNQQSK